jgi:H+/Cl- antiporter ClcA
MVDEGKWYEPDMENESAELTLRLFWAGVAMNIFVASLKPGRWIRIILIFLGLTCGAMAVFWPEVSPHFPRLTQSLQGIATNPWSWFILLMLALLLSNIIPLVESFRNGRASNKGAVSTEEKLTIHYAGYGLGFGQYYDVTESIAHLASGGWINESITNGLFNIGDPYPNATKQLYVIYSHKGDRGQQLITPEFIRLKLPA